MPGAVVAEDRLRHEGDRLAVRVGDVLDHVLVGHDLIGHAGQALEAEVDLALAARGDLVVVELARDPEPLQRQHHRRAEIVQRVVRRGREVALLRPRRVAEAGPARVPVPLARVDRVVGRVRAELVADLVEDEELALGADEAGVRDPRRAQVLLRALRHLARVARVALARDRVGDLADQRQRRRLGARVENGRARIGHQQHVRLGDPLPAADRGAVEAEPVLERVRAERAQRQRHVLPRPEQVAELEVDHRDARLGGPLERLAGVGQRLAAVHQVVPVVELRHPPLPSVGPQKKRPQLGELRGAIASDPPSAAEPAVTVAQQPDEGQGRKFVWRPGRTAGIVGCR